jgi:hypothetical protein
MESMNEKLEAMESATPRDLSKGSKEGSSQRDLLCLEAPQGAPWQNPGSENTESLTERSALLVSMVIKGIGVASLKGE